MFKEDKDYFPHILASVAATFALAAGALHYSAGKQTVVVKRAPVPLPTVCATLDRAEEMEKMPADIKAHFTLMSRLPHAGKPVLDKVMTKDVNMRICAIPALEGKAGRATRDGIEVVHGAEATTTWHETFHYRQELNDPHNIVMRGALTKADSSFYFMLIEAAAAAYEIVAEKEAANRGMAIPAPTAGVSSTQPMREAFSRAYDAAYEQHAASPEALREQRALAAGGQAAVRYLMNGNDIIWMMGYKVQALENTINMYKNLVDTGASLRSGCEAGYDEIRNYRNYSLGEVSATLNITPPEYYGPGAVTEITRVLDKMEFKVDAPALCIRGPAKPSS